MDFADLLLDLFAAAEFDEGAAAGFFGGEALGDASLGELIDVEGDLAVEFSVARASGEKGSRTSLCLLTGSVEDEGDSFGEAVPGGFFLASWRRPLAESL